MTTMGCMECGVETGHDPACPVNSPKDITVWNRFDRARAAGYAGENFRPKDAVEVLGYRRGQEKWREKLGLPNDSYLTQSLRQIRDGQAFVLIEQAGKVRPNMPIIRSGGNFFRLRQDMSLYGDPLDIPGDPLIVPFSIPSDP